MEDLTVYSFPDQDFLNEVFKNKWKPISYVYNTLKTLQWAHKPMWDINQVKNIHFILTKPWDLDINQLSDLEITYKALYKLWWNYYSEACSSTGASKSLDELLA
jgi:lipopolysaccharide biosynthesis glycosyltransferase